MGVDITKGEKKSSPYLSKQNGAGGCPIVSGKDDILMPICGHHKHKFSVTESVKRNVRTIKERVIFYSFPVHNLLAKNNCPLC